MSKKYDLKKMLFRRQFILGKSFVNDFEGWRRIRINNRYCLTIHPELMVYRNTMNGKSVTLLGFILDSINPDKTDAEIIDDLLNLLVSGENLNDIINHTYHLGGRWVLILQEGEEIRIMHDACGFRQIYFTDKIFYQDIWVASQTGILSEVLNLSYNKKIMADFFDCYEKDDGQYWWPNDATPFKEIKLLLPNHYLNANTGSSCRYWPNQNIPELGVEEGINRGSKLLKGLINSAANRYELAFSLTAGRDTRSLLAAGKEIRHKLFFFTMMYWRMTKKHVDIVIASRLLKKLGLKHHLIQCPTRMDEEFKKIYERNVPTARKVYGMLAQGLYDKFPKHKLCVKGNASSVVKFKKMTKEDRKNLDGLVLAKRAHMGKNGFAAHEFDKWLQAARKSIYNIDILTLFIWEQRLGSWQGMSQTEWDIAQEIFDPCNCRALLITLLSIPEEYRMGPKYLIFEALMKEMWSDVLCEPINPRRISVAGRFADTVQKMIFHKLRG